MASEGSLLCGGDRHFSLWLFFPFEAQDSKSLRREADVEGFAATSMASRMDGLERAELTENSQGNASRGIGWRTLSAWCGITAPCRDWLCLFRDLLTSHHSSLKNTISLIAAWVILTRTYQRHLLTLNTRHCNLLGRLLAQRAEQLRSLSSSVVHQDS